MRREKFIGAALVLVTLLAMWFSYGQPLPPATTTFTRGFLVQAVDQPTAQAYLGVSGGGGGGAVNLTTNLTNIGTLFIQTNAANPSNPVVILPRNSRLVFGTSGV